MTTSATAVEQAIGRESLGLRATGETVEVSGLRAQIQKERQERKSSEVMQRLAASEEPQTAQAAEVIDKNFGLERDAGGKKIIAVGTDTERRYNAALKAETLCRDFFTKGFDKLSASQQDELLQLIQKGAGSGREFLNTELKVLSSTDRAELQRVLKEIAADPKLKEEMISKYNQLFSERSVVDDNLEQLSAQRAALGRQLAEMDTRFSRANDEYNAVLNKLDQYKQVKADGTEGEVHKRIREIENKRPELSLEMGSIHMAMRPLQLELNTLQARLNARGITDEVMTSTIARITELEGKIAPLASRQAEIESDLKEPEFLREDQEKLEERRSKLEEERNPLLQERERLLREKAIVDADFGAKSISREMREQQFLQSIQNIPVEAARELFEKRVLENDQLRIGANEREAAETTDKAKKAVIEELSHRWQKVEDRGVGKKAKITDKKDQIINDSNKLFKDGPRGIMEQMLSGSGLTAGQIAEKLDDPGFMNEMQPRMVADLIRFRIRMGKLTDAEVELINGSDWGKEAINKAIEGNKPALEDVRKLEAEGFYKGSFGEWMRKKSNGSVLKMMLLIFGTAFLGAVPLYKAAKDAI